MVTKTPTRNEFEYGPNTLVHAPTGATWTTFPGRTELRSYRPSKLGTMLENGDLYSENEVRGVAMQLMQTPPLPPKEAEKRMERRWRRSARS
jgi:hypothetical protein